MATEMECRYGVFTTHYNCLASSLTTVFTKNEVLLIRNGYQAIKVSKCKRENTAHTKKMNLITL